MLESIRGRVERLDDQHIYLESGAFVLRLLAPAYFLRMLSPGDSGNFPVYFHLQSEGNRIVPLVVAFPDGSDREFFEKFISVSGVGVRAAVKALTRPASEIACAIAAGDHALLKSLPGIGNARAKQIVARLQDQMTAMYGSLPEAGDSTSSALYEARAVLIQLGIPASEVGELIRRVSNELGPEAGSSDLVRQVMKAGRSI